MPPSDIGPTPAHPTPVRGEAIRSIKGMNDLLPAELERWTALEETFRDVVQLHGYREIRTPIVEPTPLFVRSVGEGTDIVDKEMYSFEFHNESMTMRPEGTAGVVRAYIEHSIHAREPVSRFFYQGPMFRGERPARGRYRQFYQVGCEVFGDPGPLVDAEMIDMLVGCFVRLGIVGVEVHVNSLGGRNAKARYRARLVEHLEPHKDRLSENSRRRLTTNPLRILDSKHPDDAFAIAAAPSILESIDDDDRRHFDALCDLLTKLGTPFTVDNRLVRGLDYYTRTLFEIRGQGGELGAQNALCGGGRYDFLVEELGGPPTPAIGFAAGLERLLLAQRSVTTEKSLPVFVAPLGERAAIAALVMARKLRAQGIETLVEGRGGSLKSMLRRANSLQTRICLVVGDAELDRGIVQLKDLLGHSQREVADADLVTEVESQLRTVPPASATSDRSRAT